MRRESQSKGKSRKEKEERRRNVESRKDKTPETLRATTKAIRHGLVRQVGMGHWPRPSIGFVTERQQD
jgi:hypothetical protein